MSTLTCLHLSKGHHAVWADVALAVLQIRPKQALSTKLAIKKTQQRPSIFVIPFLHLTNCFLTMHKPLVRNICSVMFMTLLSKLQSDKIYSLFSPSSAEAAQTGWFQCNLWSTSHDQSICDVSWKACSFHFSSNSAAFLVLRLAHDVLNRISFEQFCRKHTNGDMC